MEGVDAKLLAAGSDILSSQHSSVRRGFVTVSLDLHSTSNTANGFATTSYRIISSLSLIRFDPDCDIQDAFDTALKLRKLVQVIYGPEIGNVDEGIVERGEDTGNAENVLAWVEI